MTLGGIHGEGVVGGESWGAERPARSAGAREQAPGVDGMEEVGEGMAAKDADVVLARGTSHGVTIEVYRVVEEIDLTIAHVGADRDRFCWVRVEVGEAARPLNATGEGGQVATVAGQPLGIIHQENPVQRARGGVGGGDGTAGLVPPNFAIYAVLHAGHGAPLPRAGPQPGGGRRASVSPHGAGTHSIEGKKWQENAEHIAQDIWGCSAFMLSKWDSYCRVDLGSPSQNFFRAPPARSAGKPMEHSYRYRLRFGGPIWLPKLPSIFPRDFKNFQAFFHRFFVQ